MVVDLVKFTDKGFKPTKYIMINIGYGLDFTII